MKTNILVLTLGLLLLGATGCAGMSQIAGGIGDIAGIEMPKTEEVELSVGTVCDKCSQATFNTLNPVASGAEGIKYTKVGIADVDTFVESANRLYFTVLMTEKMVGLGNQLSENPNMQVEGFQKPAEIMDLARGLFTVASQDAPNLISSGTSLVTNVQQFISPEKALILPTATEQIQLALERLQEASGKLTDLAAAFAE